MKIICGFSENNPILLINEKAIINYRHIKGKISGFDKNITYLSVLNLM